ncbi:hypothetical protein C0995_004934 [Termitomyces sp. Mi166|nr:hypothetical protein C0995_004934 [Termitomyces sp. Mi166\
MALSGVKVVEFAGLAPGPFAGLILADNGATVIRVNKPDSSTLDVLYRGKRSIAINPKVPSGRAALLKLISSADVLIDPFRPGVLERLGLGPEVFLGNADHKGLNPKLVYARVVGGALAVSTLVTIIKFRPMLSLLFETLPGADKPAFPANLLADFAGGGMTCALGILLALVEQRKSGRGQVVNTDMVSGAQYVASYPLIHSLARNTPLFGHGRGKNILDGGAPFYDVYVCKDGQYMTVGCIEVQFFKVFIERFLEALPKGFNLNGWRPSPQTRTKSDDWGKLRDFMVNGFKTNTRDYWAAAFHGTRHATSHSIPPADHSYKETDACALPVLTPEEARASVSSDESFPAAHPRVLGSQPVKSPPPMKHLYPGQHNQEILLELGLSDKEIRQLAADGALGKEGRSSVGSGHKL